MNSQSQKRLIFHWDTPKNFLAILLFIALTVIIQFAIITYTVPAIVEDPTAFTLNAMNVTISPFYHLIPTAAIIALTASFIHLTSNIATIPQKTQLAKRQAPQAARQKPSHLKTLKQFSKQIRRTTRKIRNKILKTPTIAHIQHRVVLAKAIIKSATTVIVVFIAVILIVTIAAYPKLIPSATANFYQWNTAFLSFVVATIEVSQNIANTIPPIGAVATAMHGALIAAAPSFRNSLEATASTITSGLVALGPTEKYFIIQNASAWAVAIITLMYSQYIKTRRYRR
ncbi:MAG: hypothetical protein ACLFU9_05395 [Candidatus Bathyarchaeia archaeon]